MSRLAWVDNHVVEVISGYQPFRRSWCRLSTLSMWAISRFLEGYVGYKLFCLCFMCGISTVLSMVVCAINHYDAVNVGYQYICRYWCGLSTISVLSILLWAINFFVDIGVGYQPSCRYWCVLSAILSILVWAINHFARASWGHEPFCRSEYGISTILLILVWAINPFVVIDVGFQPLCRYWCGLSSILMYNCVG